ncbi:hypothetical protein [Gymnodinialimonas ceratoperidinii]|uniref:Uncharacterized protein n=1 Tax=Gymnodinialimonas ceratoperidinii TaxID=2856823 RepID=A0A8F6YB54_9RHOB|nr:hypothetical protein [Gymnodinialimonas ceratoperidinii]QXT40208.1 hypothetical protein KYE46_02820 [Gymnodinialimonas ceratoperidinii]
MDILALTFYASVCGVLSLASPALGTALLRLAAGAVVGIAAASALPLIRSTIGY